MVRYIVRRLFWVVLLLFLVSLLTFVVFYSFPSADPAQLRAGRQPNPQLVEQIRHALGLDKPWYVQYWRYMKALVLHFDFGRSYHYNAPVRKQIFDAVAPTASLTIGAAVLWLLSGLAIGTVSAVRRGKLIDRLTMGGALAKAWGALDKQVTDQSYFIAWLWDNNIGLESSDVNGVPSRFNSGQWDFVFSSLKK